MFLYLWWSHLIQTLGWIEFIVCSQWKISQSFKEGVNMDKIQCIIFIQEYEKRHDQMDRRFANAIQQVLQEE